MMIITLIGMAVLAAAYVFEVPPDGLEACEDVGQTTENCPDRTADEIDSVDDTEVEEEFVACTMDAKQCPDGSYVGRIGPDCTFSDCPTSPAPASSAEDFACLAVYEPVCALVEVQCVTAPCNPVEQTFSNSCYASQQQNVLSFSAGECGSE